MPVSRRNNGNKNGSIYIAMTIIYLISPPPKIILGISSNIITKKIRIVNDIINEYKFNLFSKYPKINKKIIRVARVIFGILYLVQSKKDKKSEKI